MYTSVAGAADTSGSSASSRVVTWSARGSSRVDCGRGPAPPARRAGPPRRSGRVGRESGREERGSRPGPFGKDRVVKRALPRRRSRSRGREVAQLAERLRVGGRDNRRCGSQVAVRHGVRPGAPGDRDLADDAVRGDWQSGGEQRRGSGGGSTADIAEREDADRLAFLEAGLPGDLAGGDGTAVDGRAAGWFADVSPSAVIVPVIRRRVAPPMSSRTAARMSVGVVPVPGSILETGPTSTQPSCAGSWPYIIPLTTRSGRPEEGLPRLSSVISRSLPFQRMVLCVQVWPSRVIRTVAVPDWSAEAAGSLAAIFTAAAAPWTPGVTPDEPRVRNTATAAVVASAMPAREADQPTRAELPTMRLISADGGFDPHPQLGRGEIDRLCETGLVAGVGPAKGFEAVCCLHHPPPPTRVTEFVASR